MRRGAGLYAARIDAPRALAAVACLAALLAMTGCRNGKTTQRESAQGAVDTLLEACGRDRPAVASEVLNEPARQAFTRAPSAAAGCLELLGLRSPSPRDPAAVQRAIRATRVVRVDANDLSGTVVIAAPGGIRSMLEVEKVGGDWRVAHAARPGAT